MKNAEQAAPRLVECAAAYLSLSQPPLACEAG